MPRQGKIEAQIGRDAHNRLKQAVVRAGGREAVTHYAVEESFRNDLASLVRCRLETGRTHQIRVHMAHISPSAGGRPALRLGLRDPSRRSCRTTPQRRFCASPGQALHAGLLGFAIR